MALSKHAAHYGPQSGFPYYDLTMPVERASSIHHLGHSVWALQKFGNWKGKFNELKLNLNVQCIDVCHIKWCQRNVVFYIQEAW